MFLVNWWCGMSSAGQIFACFAIPTTLLLLIQTIMMLTGLGGDEDFGDGAPDDISDIPDTDSTFDDISDAVGLDGLRIFTIRGIVAFFVVFGWVGVAMDGAGIALYITLPVAVICGFAMMLALAYIFKAIMKLRNDGNTDNRNAIGVSGKVHLTIPPSRKGEGKVHIMLQGAYVERDAVTDEGTAIPTGSEVVVVGLSGQTNLVVKKK